MKFRALLGALGVVSAILPAIVVGCEGDDESGGIVPPKTAAEAFCAALSNYASGCGPKSPCDDALVKDCADVTAMLSDSYLRAAAECVQGGAQPVGCLVSSVGAIEQSAAHGEFADAFCSDCALGIPGCKDILFGAGDSEVQAAGKLLLPLGDELVRQIIDECMGGGLTCLPMFPSCVEGVLAKRAIPEATVSCLLKPPPPSTEAPTPCPEGAGGSGPSGSGPSSGPTTSAASGSGSSSTGTPMPHECSMQSTSEACHDCCKTEEKAGLIQINVLFINACSCDIGSPCNGLCPDLCTGGQSYSDACKQCMDGEADKAQDSACYTATIDQCWDDPVCEPFATCSVQCRD